MYIVKKRDKTFILLLIIICISIFFYYHVSADNNASPIDIDGHCKKMLACSGETITCCPDDKNFCDPQKCSCTKDTDCPGQQICLKNGTCACPGKGRPSMVDPNVCCGTNYDKGYAWDRDEYNILNMEMCGCPGKGQTSQTNPKICCYNGYAYHENNDRANGYVKPHIDCPCEQDGFPNPQIAFSLNWQKNFYCSHHKWTTERSYICGDENNPFTCREKSQGYACEPWGECLCFNEMFTYPECGRR